MMHLDDLRYFQAVAHAKSFARGARAVHVSAPAISKAVQRLEQTLGRKLFERTTRHVELTDAGRLLLVSCQHVFSELDQLEVELGLRDTEPRGELRVAAMEVFSIQLLPRALAALVREHPTVTLAVYEMIPERMVAALQEGRIDIAFTIGARPQKGIALRSLGRTRAVVVCGRSHPLYENGRLGRRDLETHPFVAPRFWGAEHLPPLDQFPEQRLPRRVEASIELLQMEIELVKSGAYLGFLPEISVMRELSDGSLRALGGLALDTHFDLQVLAREGALKPAAQRLLEHATRELGSRLRAKRR